MGVKKKTNKAAAKNSCLAGFQKALRPKTSQSMFLDRPKVLRAQALAVGDSHRSPGLAQEDVGLKTSPKPRACGTKNVPENHRS
jgi:hypothetical protein